MAVIDFASSGKGWHRVKHVTVQDVAETALDARVRPARDRRLEADRATRGSGWILSNVLGELAVEL